MVTNHRLKKIDETIHRELKSLLFDMVPEYAKDYQEYEAFEEGIYLYMNEFATDLSEKIRISNCSNYVNEAFKYINLLGESDNLEILNIVRVGILEILYTTACLDRSIVSGLLSEKLRIYFNDFSNYYIHLLK